MKYFFLALMLVIGIVGFSQELWNGTTLGMTKEQILAIYPTAIESIVYKKDTSEIISKNLVLHDFDILGSLYNVSFLLGTDNKLNKVSITPKGPNLDIAAANSRFQMLLGMFRNKYGKETFYIAPPSPRDGEESATWRLSDKTVYLFKMNTGSINMSVFFFQYSQAVPDESNKF